MTQYMIYCANLAVTIIILPKISSLVITENDHGWQETTPCTCIENLHS